MYKPSTTMRKVSTSIKPLALAIFWLGTLSWTTRAEQCGSQAGGAVCPNNLCCSKWGYCGSTTDYCGTGCQSQCTPGNGSPPPPPPTPPTSGGGNGVASIISQSLFEQMLKHRNDSACPGKGFYTYDAFIAAANSFNGFGTTGDLDTRKREIAAFFGQTSHETTGMLLKFCTIIVYCSEHTC
jgi:basic endochitinase B